MSQRHLGPFFALSFAITWGLGVLVIGFGDSLAHWLGPLDLKRPGWRALVHLATYAPAIAALIVIARAEGGAGLRAFGRRLVRVRGGLAIWLVVLLAYPALRFAARALTNAITGEDVPLFAIEPVWHVVPALALASIADPGALEEPGWRGFALPLLQRRFGALAASALLGVIWGVWHLPAFFVSAMSQSGFAFPVFVAGSVVLSMLMAAVYNSSGGAVLPVLAMHAIGNFRFGVETSGSTAEMLVATLLGAGVVLAIVLWRGADTLGVRRETEVLMR